MTRTPHPTEPTPLQTLILWALVVLGGEAAQKALRPELKKPDRDALARLGLLRTVTVKRSIQVELTDRGWAWTAANTAAPLATSNAGGIVLAALLARLGDYMAAHGVALADIIRPAPAQPAPAPPQPAPPQPVPAASGSGALSGRIRAACLGETGGAVNRRVRLSAIRARLADVARDELDAALLALTHSGAADLLPLDDPAEIGDADRAAAIPVGVEARHLLWLHR